MEDCIDKNLVLVTGEKSPCQSQDCVAHPKIFVAKSIAEHTCIEQANEPPLSNELGLIAGMSYNLTEEGNYVVTFDSFCYPKTETTGTDILTYAIFVNGIEVTVSRRRVNVIAIAGPIKKKYVIYTSTSTISTSGPVTVEVRACITKSKINPCTISARVLSIYRMP